MILYGMVTPHLVYSFLVRWTFELFPHSGTTVNSAAMNIRGQESIWTRFQFFGVHTSEWTVGSHGNSARFVEQLSDCSTLAVSLYTPTSNVRGFQFLHLLTNTYFPLFGSSHPTECEVVSCCLVLTGISLTKLNGIKVNDIIFSCTCLAIPLSPSEACLLKSSASF